MRGVTLIELLITLSIVAILATIAYPSYMEHINRSRRVDAQAALLELAQWMERNYMTNLSYILTDNSNTDITSTRFQQYLQGRTVLDHYNFALANLSGNAFTLSATPQGAQANDRCGTLTLDNLGQKGTTLLSVQECW